MATLNKKTEGTGRKTFEGGPAIGSRGAGVELRRAVSCCLLWENQFYESGQEIGNRIAELVGKTNADEVAQLAVEARSVLNLRHVPLLLCVELARLGKLRAETLTAVIQRPDELCEFMAIYWRDGKCKLSNQAKKGLAEAFGKFNEYQLAKYNRDRAIKLRDVMFLTHPKPEGADRESLYKRLAEGNLATPDTWEVALSGGANKKEVFTRMLNEKTLGGLALLRNLRNMEQAGVGRSLIRNSVLNMRTDRILPFRFISAAKYAPTLEDVLEKAMLKSLADVPKLKGHTVLLVDNSGSMTWANVSARSELNRQDAAGALAILLREICEDVTVLAFSNGVTPVANRRGFGLAEAIKRTSCAGTHLGAAVKHANAIKSDRLIVLTDEQSHDAVGAAKADKAYMLNVASQRNEVGFGAWTRISGWSENVTRYITEVESM
jgi:60 kDa SS-A/Ro ribonucleoprotein